MDVDLVYTWVNPHDPRWQAERHRYAATEVLEDELYSNGELRYRDHGELAYSLRSVERYLPFVRRIYIAHAGSPPNWLRFGEKIFFIRQEDLLPRGVAPTFQSDVIECFLYNIPGLSEHYLYSNDDFFFRQSHSPADFFRANGQCLVGVSDGFAGMGSEDGLFEACEANSVHALQRRLRLPAHIPVGSKRLSKAFNHPRLQTRALLRGMRLLNTPTHVTQPYRRSYWEGFHCLFEEEIKHLCSRRFRSRNGLAINMMYHHYLRCLGKSLFYYEPRHAYIDRSHTLEDRATFRNALLAEPSRITRFCLNDDASPAEDDWASFIRSLMDSLDYCGIDRHACLQRGSPYRGHHRLGAGAEWDAA